MAQSGEATAYAQQSRVPTMQKWLTGIFFACLGASIVVSIVGNHVAREFGLVASQLLVGAGFAVAGIGQGLVFVLFPRLVGRGPRGVTVPDGHMRLMGLALIWLGIWATATCVIDALSLANTQQVASDEVYIVGGIIALTPLTALGVFAWIRHYPERKQARAAARQAREALALILAANGYAGRGYTQWRDRWRNRVRRVQHRQTRG